MTAALLDRPVAARPLRPATGARTRYLLIGSGLLLSIWSIWSGLLRLPSRYSTSYWTITWDHGFVRRGLGGEINQATFGPILGMETGAYALSIGAGLAGGVALLVVAWMLLLRKDLRLAWAGLLLIAVPATIRSTVAFGRPDPYAFWSLLLVGLATTMGAKPRLRRALLLGAGLLLGAMTLVQEATDIQIVPWAVLLIVTSATEWDWRARLADLASFLSVPAVMLGLVVLKGTATHEQLLLLKADSNGWLVSAKGGNATNYLSDSVGYGVKTVLAIGPSGMIAMFGFGALIFLVIPALVSRLAGVELGSMFTGVPARLTLWLLVLPAFALQMATGFDWLRWLSTWGTLWMLTAAMMMLRGDPLFTGKVTASGPVRWRTALLAISVVALSLVPTGPTVALGSCAYSYTVREWKYPISKAITILNGKTPHAKNFPRKHCGSLNLPPRAGVEG